MSQKNPAATTSRSAPEESTKITPNNQQHPSSAANSHPHSSNAVASEQPGSPSGKADDAGQALARLVLEDFVVTTLLRLGRSLSSNDITAAAEGFQLSRAVLKEGLAQSRRVIHAGRDWDLSIRVKRQTVSREERERQPLQG